LKSRPKPADSDLALLRVVCKRFVEIGRAEGDDTKLPRVELPGHGQIDVEEVRVAALDGKWRRTWRQLRTPVRDMGELGAPDDIGGQVPLVAGIAEREALIDRGRTPGRFATGVEIGAEQVAEAPIVSEVPRQLARD
jgi:hypothetical protein